MRSFFSMIATWIKNFFRSVFKKRTPEDNTEIVDYYGCPNSNKAKKLQLSKKLLK